MEFLKDLFFNLVVDKYDYLGNMLATPDTANRYYDCYVRLDNRVFFGTGANMLVEINRDISYLNLDAYGFIEGAGTKAPILISREEFNAWYKAKGLTRSHFNQIHYDRAFEIEAIKKPTLERLPNGYGYALRCMGKTSYVSKKSLSVPDKITIYKPNTNPVEWDLSLFNALMRTGLNAVDITEWYPLGEDKGRLYYNPLSPKRWYEIKEVTANDNYNFTVDSTYSGEGPRKYFYLSLVFDAAELQGYTFDLKDIIKDATQNRTGLHPYKEFRTQLKLDSILVTSKQMTIRLADYLSRQENPDWLKTHPYLYNYREAKNICKVIE